MATANRSGDSRRAEDDDPDRTQRVPVGMQEVVDQWFPEPVEPTQMDNRTARRMNEQHERGEATTGRRAGCPLFAALAVAVIALAGLAVR